MRILIRLFTLMVLMVIRVWIQILASKVLNLARIQYTSACNLQINANPEPAYHFDADPDYYLMRMQIKVTKMMRIRLRMRIRIHNTAPGITVWGQSRLSSQPIPKGTVNLLG
jgi:hypothetical protein